MCACGGSGSDSGESAGSTAGDASTGTGTDTDGGTTPATTTDPPPTTGPTETTDETATTLISTDATEPNPTTDPTDTDTSDTDTTDTDTTDTGGPVNGDFDALSMCGGDVVCPEWLEFFAESEPYTMAPERICVFEGLRDGTIGRYTYSVDHEFGNGNYRTTNVIVVHADRKVTFAQHHDGYTDEEGPFDIFDPALTCTLAEADFFDACPMADPFDQACYWLPDPWGDDLPFPWFTDCVAMGPMCM